MGHMLGETCAKRVRAAALLLLAWPLAALAEPRIALVMGNSAYTSGPLLNPVNDAKLMGDTLTRLGFQVIARRDSDQATMKRAIQEFGAKLEQAGPDAVGLFFYAGHGVSISGRNYLIPTTARIDREADVEIEAVSADWVLDQMRYARNRLNIVILDACRNNPYTRSMRSADRGLARMDAPAGTLIAYSTAPGDVAADGEGRNSPYSLALAQAIGGVREPVEQAFKRARVAVMAATNNRQTPWESSSLTGDFYFASAGAGAGATSSARPAAPPVVVASLPKTSNSSPPAVRPVVQEPAREPRAPAAPASQAACMGVVGRWRVAGVPGEVAIGDDHTLQWWQNPGDKLPSVTGKWSCQSAAARRYVMMWGHGSIDTLVLSEDGRALTGKNQFGLQIAQTRLQ